MQEPTDCKNYATTQRAPKFEKRCTKLHSIARSAVREFRVHCAGSSRHVAVASRTVFACIPRVCHPPGGVPYEVAQKFRQVEKNIGKPVRRFEAHSQYISRGIDVVSCAHCRTHETIDCKNYASRQRAPRFAQRCTKLYSIGISPVPKFEVHSHCRSRDVIVASGASLARRRPRVAK